MLTLKHTAHTRAQYSFENEKSRTQQEVTAYRRPREDSVCGGEDTDGEVTESCVDPENVIREPHIHEGGRLGVLDRDPCVHEKKMGRGSEEQEVESIGDQDGDPDANRRQRIRQADKDRIEGVEDTDGDVCVARRKQERGGFALRVRFCTETSVRQCGKQVGLLITITVAWSQTRYMSVSACLHPSCDCLV